MGPEVMILRSPQGPNNLYKSQKNVHGGGGGDTNTISQVFKLSYRLLVSVEYAQLIDLQLHLNIPFAYMLCTAK